MNLQIFFVSLFLLKAIICENQENVAEIVNYDMNVSVQTQIAHENHNFYIKNLQKKVLYTVDFYITSEDAKVLGKFAPHDDERSVLEYKQTTVGTKLVKNHQTGKVVEKIGFEKFTIFLKNPLESQQTVGLSVNMFFQDKYRFTPPQITMEDKQIIKYNLGLIPASPYEIKRLVGRLVYSKKGTQHHFNTVTDIAPWTHKKHTFTLHLDSDCLQFIEANRTVTISHWGNVKIQDHQNLRNNGAEFIGEYNPILMPKHQPSAMFHGISIELPENAWGFSYRDELGNISSTKATKDKQKPSIYIQPRFPLFGQWNATWYIEYNLPIEELVSYDAEKDIHIFKTKMALPYGTIPSRQLHLKVVQPEGSILQNSFFNTTSLKSVTTEFTNNLLNFFGRPTAYATFKDFVSVIEHGEYSVEYTFKPHYFLIAPSYLAIGAFFTFLGYIILNRIDFDFKNISEREKEELESESEDDNE